MLSGEQLIRKLIKRSDDVDITQYPREEDISKHEPDVVVLGDLHGNVLLFVYGLIFNNVLGMDKKFYEEQLVPAYLSAGSDLAKVEKFNELLRNVPKVIRSPRHLVLIGDVLGDRGENDTLTLEAFEILKIIRKNGGKVSIPFSNHDMHFLKIFVVLMNDPEALYKLIEDPRCCGGFVATVFTRSLQNALLTLKQKADQTSLIDAMRFFKELVEENYLPFLTALDYVVIPTAPATILLLTHAPAGFEVVSELYYFCFQTEFKPRSYQDIIDAIVAIQTHFRKISPTDLIKIQEEQEHILKDAGYNIGEDALPLRVNGKSTVLFYLTWTRLKNGVGPWSIFPAHFINACGHLGKGWITGQQVCVDEPTGRHGDAEEKFAMINRGPYSCLSFVSQSFKPEEKIQPLKQEVKSASVAPEEDEKTKQAMAEKTAELKAFIERLNLKIDESKAEVKAEAKTGFFARLAACASREPPPSGYSDTVQLAAAEKMLSYYEGKGSKRVEFTIENDQILLDETTELGKIIKKMISEPPRPLGVFNKFRRELRDRQRRSDLSEGP